MEEVGHSVEELTLDTVEFCPTLGGTGLGVVGAYDLHPDGQTRRGSLALFRIRREDQAAAPADKKRKVEWLWRGQEGIDDVLDFKWCASLTFRHHHHYGVIGQLFALNAGVCRHWAGVAHWAPRHRPRARYHHSQHNVVAVS
jgi:hypothetical protein